MQYIDINLPKIIEARDNHYLFMRYIIKKKLNGPNFNGTKPLKNMNQIKIVSNIDTLNKKVIDFLNDDDNLKKILIGTPEELDSIKSMFIDSEEELETLKKIINYKAWINKKKDDNTYKHYNAYHLAEKLDIPTCIYCNRIYTKTVIDKSGKKITRPTFDHWFPKSEYPLLALSFYNLIPSCTVCNSGVKGADPFQLSTHFHPYHRDVKNELKYRFSYYHKNYDKYEFKIKTNDDDKFSEDSVNAFQLENIYQAHEDEIEDLRRIKDAYSEDYIKNLEEKILCGISLDRNEVYRLAFGVHFEEAKFDRRPLSKMKKDILIELGIIEE